MAANSALAALVTQAPDDQESEAQNSGHWAGKREQLQKQSRPAPAAGLPPVHQNNTEPAPPAKGKSGVWFFRWFRKGKDVKDSKPSQKQKMAAIVPSQEAEAVNYRPSPHHREEHGGQKAASRTSREAKETNGSKGAKESHTRSPPEKKTSEDQEQALRKQSGPSASSIATKVQPAQEGTGQRQGSPGTQDAKGIKEGHIVTVTNPGGEPPQLGPQTGLNIGRKTLVLDLDETLVHSSFRVVPKADIVISVEIEGENHQVYVRKRPGCDEFLLRVAELYEIVIYTASMSKYANPLLDKLDKAGVCTWRLFREACTRLSSGYVKDLSRLGRDLTSTIIIDNSPVCYSLQPDNAIPIQTWRDDVNDRELLDLIPILTSLADVDDIPFVLRQIIWAGDDETFDENDG